MGDGRRLTHESPQPDVAWARSRPAGALREVILLGFLAAAMDVYTRHSVIGREHLDDLEGPALFVANHSSHMDTPAILRALPARWRRRTVVAAATDYFYRARRNAVAVSLLFNTIPMERDGGGLKPRATSHMDGLIDDGWSLLVFPEGTRSRNGKLGRLRSGAAVLALEHGLAIVPIFVSGTRTAMPPGHKWMRRELRRRHPIKIRFGSPIHETADEDPAVVMERVRLFYEAAGATTTPSEDPRPISA
jgi:1-acyl-sn-glycerol-3-phosphate acyltransferase